MSQYPLNELKRRLEDEDTPLTKRFKLAKNVVQSQHFPTAPKERVIAEWLDELTKDNKITSKELCDVLGWLNNVDDFTCELKSKLIKVVSQYLQSNILESNDSDNIIAFLENSKLSHQLSLQIEDFLFITTTLLQNFQNEPNNTLVTKILDNIGKYYKESKKKLEFIIKYLEGDHLETIFGFLHTECHSAVMNLCENVLFPIGKKQFYSSFLTNLIRKDNIDELIAEKGDNIQSVLKIMGSFFTFPKGRTDEDPKFLSDFIHAFVSCFRHESQICFAFYIMATNAFSMTQNYMVPAMQMPPITFDNDKVRRSLFLKMLEVLHSHEVDVTVRLTDTLGEKIAKVEIKKVFITFIQAVMMGQLKLEGKLDRVTVQIIELALKLDPSIVEQRMDKILPYVMTVKKNKSDVLEHYTKMMNYFLETLFKLSRGAEFVNQIIPHIKLSLEATNVEQFELKQKITEAVKNGDSISKMKAAILTGNDILPEECIQLYGRLSSELMFRQNKVLLLSLQKDFEENCLMMLEEGFVSPSIITLSELLSAILSSFFKHNKMADHTVPLPIAEDFWSAFQQFEDQCLNKFGECVMKLNYNPSLVLAFLQLCLSFSQLKVLNIKYGNTKLNVAENKLIPFLSTDKWIDFTGGIQEEDAILLWDQVQLVQIMANEILNTDDTSETETKTNIIKRILKHPHVLMGDSYFTDALLRNLNKNQIKILSKTILRTFSNSNDTEIFNTHALSNSRVLLQNILLKVSKNCIDCLDNLDSLSKALNKSTFDVNLYLKDNNVRELFNDINIKNEEELDGNIEIFKHLQIQYLNENSQLTAILILLLAKNCCQHKTVKRNIDCVLQSIYELSPKYPDIYKLFPVDFIFDFNDNRILELLKLNNKTSNGRMILKNTLESAVKKVKTDPDIVKSIVEILLTNLGANEIKSINYFDNPVFQISCQILPIIAKEKKNITTSAYRSILAELQDKLNTAMLDSFKNIDFDANDDESVNDASLNAMGPYSLTLLKFCESNVNDIDIKNLNCLLSGLKFFVDISINSIQDQSSKAEHIERSVNMLNITLRYWKKLASLAEKTDKSSIVEFLADPDKLYHRIWVSINSRLYMVYDQSHRIKISNTCTEEISVTLKFLAELSSVECFSDNFEADLSKLTHLKNPSSLVSRKVSRYLWQHCLNANIIEAKCVEMTKIISRSTITLSNWLQQNYNIIDPQSGGNVMNCVIIDDGICEMLRYDLDVLSDVVLAAKKINIDHKFLDSIFQLMHIFQYQIGAYSTHSKCVVSFGSFVMVFEGCAVLLNNLLQSREEMLEDRWPCYMQCYKTLIQCLCDRAKMEDDANKFAEHKLAELGHSMEKLTQSICKRKTHVSRIAAYAVADICTWIESKQPPRMLRQHLENSIALLIQASDSTYAMAFLRRALAGSVGQTTLTNMYNMYKKYHKYVGNA